MVAPSPGKKYPAFDTALAALGDWLRVRQQIWLASRRLGEIDGGELASIASDVGLSANELRRMVNHAPDAAKLVLERMAALQLDPSAIAKNVPATARDMQRLCCDCDRKKRCRQDLSHNPDDPAWRRYCPNAGTLDALQSEATKIH